MAEKRRFSSELDQLSYNCSGCTIGKLKDQATNRSSWWKSKIEYEHYLSINQSAFLSSYFCNIRILVDHTIYSIILCYIQIVLKLWPKLGSEFCLLSGAVIKWTITCPDFRTIFTAVVKQQLVGSQLERSQIVITTWCDGHNFKDRSYVTFPKTIVI